MILNNIAGIEPSRLYLENRDSQLVKTFKTREIWNSEILLVASISDEIFVLILFMTC